MRHEGDKGLFIIFYEPWVLSISLDDFANGDTMDPDRPHADHKPNCQAQDRTSYSSTKLIQCKTCLRYFFSLYLDDKSPNGAWTSYLVKMSSEYAKHLISTPISAVIAMKTMVSILPTSFRDHYSQVSHQLSSQSARGLHIAWPKIELLPILDSFHGSSLLMKMIRSVVSERCTIFFHISNMSNLFGHQQSQFDHQKTLLHCWRKPTSGERNGLGP